MPIETKPRIALGAPRRLTSGLRSIIHCVACRFTLCGPIPALLMALLAYLNIVHEPPRRPHAGQRKLCPRGHG